MLDQIVELIRLTATSIAPEVLAALKAGRELEEENSAASAIYDQIFENIALADNNSLPLCQDSGIPIFSVKLPSSESPSAFTCLLQEATKIATEANYLRPNAVNTLTDANSGMGIGRGIPQITIETWGQSGIEVGLMLKGGGSENVGVQYSLPDSELNAERDLAGVANCVIDAVFQAQGKACPPYFIGVGIGGDRAGAMKLAKAQFWRPLDDMRPELGKWEKDLRAKLNQLGIGPMGIGGKGTVLSVKADYLDRVPASFFVSVAFTCWAYRRRGLSINGNEVRYA